jgi:hypothetical protein
VTDFAVHLQGVARRVSDMLQRPVVSYANGREVVITFGQDEVSALPSGSPGWVGRRQRTHEQ